MRYLTMRFLPVCIILAHIVFTNAAFAQNFRASVVKVDITPDNSQQLLGYQARKSTGVHDKIYHRIVAMDDGKTQFYIISTDICLISPSQYDKLTARLQKQLGITPMQVWWAATHTHSAPEVGPAGLPSVFLGDRYKHEFDAQYTDLVEQKIVDGMVEAKKNLAPAKLGTGWGSSNANINRRARSIEGKTSLGMNPDGPVDRRIGLLRLEKTDGSLLALIANYAMHGTVMSGENLLISGDGPGIVSEYVEQKTGAPLLYINGAAGNIAPIYSVYPSPAAGRLNQFKAMLGEKIIDASKTITATSNQVTLKAAGTIVEIPRKEGLGWPDDLRNYTRTTKAGVNMIRLPVRFLKVNDDVAIWSAPLELFCEISNEVRDRSPFPYTFYFGYTNGWLGYLLAEEELQYGGYEPTVSPYAPGAAKSLTEAVVNYLQGDMRSGH
ncbi:MULTISPECIES: neutral/alkaline non-lysosomal ceramidase N-terminal domain-containing protein [Dyadobacter]|uniref:Neutral ceramidase n=1 Tax=Dyadobacter chenhuakuii TaxID=2909339 RepID=A0A9X1TSS2_9BACT|nr:MULTISPECIES: neutral/alkaline non-lysosomal ceramidase N-terminal domain-containing protein [Dyadobacter]MCE7070021.1 neutral/alkaline non-lysosomal ceramidase N-terminal domain-containing protein [Dyadobacter sp. CY327]MCF2497227.1 neutral/alkaline non-lysosomal ceramidase N-terminal domain-containing protein [Dyadobacter chenhuakuii]